MIDQLLHYFEKYIPLNQEEKKMVREHIPVRAVDKNQLLLKEGEVSHAFYFILSGCVRLFYPVGLEEKTAFFYLENMFASSYESFTKQIPAKHSLQAIEDSKVAIITSQTAHKLLEISPKFEFLARVIMEEELIVCQEIISSFVTLNAEQRYAHLLNTYSELVRRIPQYHLATYLGVTPETLSRIRNRISSKSIS